MEEENFMSKWQQLNDHEDLKKPFTQERYSTRTSAK
jgi:hypothetical protein